MKETNKIWKIVAGIAAVAGVIFVIATYGDKIVAWAKRLIGHDECDYICDDDCENCDCTCEDCECECDMVEETDFQN